MAAGTTRQSITMTTTQSDGEIFTNTITTKLITHDAESLPSIKTDQLLSTSFVSIDYGDVDSSKKHIVTVRNMDSAITVYLSFNASTEQIDLAPGELFSSPIKGGITVSIKGASGTPYAHVVVSQLKA
jgi:hypothetical protein